MGKQCRQRCGQCGGTGKTATDWLRQQLQNKMAHLQECRRRLQWNLQHPRLSFGQGMEQGQRLKFDAKRLFLRSQTEDQYQTYVSQWGGSRCVGPRHWRIAGQNLEV